MKSTSCTPKRFAHDVRFHLRQAELAAHMANYGAPSAKAGDLARKLESAAARLKGVAAELEEEMA